MTLLGGWGWKITSWDLFQHKSSHDLMNISRFFKASRIKFSWTKLSRWQNEFSEIIQVPFSLVILRNLDLNTDSLCQEPILIWYNACFSQGVSKRKTQGTVKCFKTTMYNGFAFHFNFIFHALSWKQLPLHKEVTSLKHLRHWRHDFRLALLRGLILHF